MQQPDPQMVKLTMLLQLEQRARHASLAELPFVVVNETGRVLAYRQAALWVVRPQGGGRVEAVSGVAVPDRDGPMCLWLRSMFRKAVAGDMVKGATPVEASNFPRAIGEDWGEWFPEHCLLLPLNGPGGEMLALLALFRESPWTSADRHIGSYLVDGFGHSLALAMRPGRRAGLKARLAGRRSMVAIACLLFLLSFLPIRQSALAPAVVEPANPEFVRSPLDGVVDQFHVRPNQTVEQGQPLLSLDDTELRTRLEVARKAWEIANEEFLQASQQAIFDPDAKARTAILRTRMEQQAAEAAYVESLLERVVILSPIDGVAIFDDPDDWIGRPVTVGETILLVSEPEDMELELQVMAEDAVALEEGAEVLFFLNVSPGRPVSARISYASYNAAPTPSGMLAYRVVASFEDTGDGLDDRLRIGLQGTGKIYGPRTPLIMAALRVPIRYVRQWMGI